MNTNQPENPTPLQNGHVTPATQPQPTASEVVVLVPDNRAYYMAEQCQEKLVACLLCVLLLAAGLYLVQKQIDDINEQL